MYGCYCLILFWNFLVVLNFFVMLKHQFYLVWVFCLLVCSVGLFPFLFRHSVVSFPCFRSFCLYLRLCPSFSAHFDLNLSIYSDIYQCPYFQRFDWILKLRLCEFYFDTVFHCNCSNFY